MSVSSLVRLALFRWGDPPEIPPGAHAFAYHTYLVPMMAVLLALQAIEIGVVHLLVYQWSHRAAFVLALIGVAGFVWLLALLKSLRLRPILVTTEGIRLRTGLLYDCFIAFPDIASVTGNFTGDDVRAGNTRNMGLLAWPNVMVRLHHPLAHGLKLGRSRPAHEAFAFKLDNPGEFVRQVTERLDRSDRSAITAG